MQEIKRYVASLRRKRELIHLIQVQLVPLLYKRSVRIHTLFLHSVGSTLYFLILIQSEIQLCISSHRIQSEIQLCISWYRIQSEIFSNSFTLWNMLHSLQYCNVIHGNAPIHSGPSSAFSAFAWMLLSVQISCWNLFLCYCLYFCICFLQIM